jgi:hypothetical protein
MRGTKETTGIGIGIPITTLWAYKLWLETDVIFACAMFLHGLPQGAIEQLLQDQPSHESLVTISVPGLEQLYSVILVFRRNNSEQEAALETAVDAFISGK